MGFSNCHRVSRASVLKVRTHDKSATFPSRVVLPQSQGFQNICKQLKNPSGEKDKWKRRLLLKRLSIVLSCFVSFIWLLSFFGGLEGMPHREKLYLHGGIYIYIYTLCSCKSNRFERLPACYPRNQVCHINAVEKGEI
jgi:hypothetical protein